MTGKLLEHHISWSRPPRASGRQRPSRVVDSESAGGAFNGEMVDAPVLARTHRQAGSHAMSVRHHENLLAAVLEMRMLLRQMRMGGLHQGVVIDAFQQHPARALQVALPRCCHR